MGVRKRLAALGLAGVLAAGCAAAKQPIKNDGDPLAAYVTLARHQGAGEPATIDGITVDYLEPRNGRVTIPKPGATSTAKNRSYDSLSVGPGQHYIQFTRGERTALLLVGREGAYLRTPNDGGWTTPAQVKDGIAAARRYLGGRR